jgi:LysR family glycine cleavage system transcriptional activator
MPFFASELVIPRLPGFVSAQRHLDLRIETRMLRHGEHVIDSDVSVLLCRQPPVGLSSYALLQTRLVAACAPELRKRLNGHSLDDLASDPELTVIVQQSRPEAWTEWLAAAGAKPAASRKLIQLDTMDAVVAAAERGLGIALVPMPLVGARLERGSLVRLCQSFLETRDTYYLVHRVEDERRPEVRALRDWMLSEFTSDG